MCEWVSMMPGIATIPEASITLTLSGADSPVPTALILPASTRIEPLAIVPRVTVRIVASLMRTLPPVWSAGLRSSSSSVATSTSGGRAALAAGVWEAPFFDGSAVAPARRLWPLAAAGVPVAGAGAAVLALLSTAATAFGSAVFLSAERVVAPITGFAVGSAAGFWAGCSTPVEPAVPSGASSPSGIEPRPPRGPRPGRSPPAATSAPPGRPLARARSSGLISNLRPSTST